MTVKIPCLYKIMPLQRACPKFFVPKAASSELALPGLQGLQGTQGDQGKRGVHGLHVQEVQGLQGVQIIQGNHGAVPKFGEIVSTEKLGIRKVRSGSTTDSKTRHHIDQKLDLHVAGKKRKTPTCLDSNLINKKRKVAAS